MDDGVIKKYKLKIISLLRALFPDVKIYLYGSRAQGSHREWSDIDLALDGGQALERYDLGEAREILAGSRVPYTVQIVDLHAISPEFKEAIKKDLILWQE